MSGPFSEPAAGGGDRLNPRDIVGMLLIVRPTEYITGLVTRYTKPGETSDAVRLDVCNLDEKDQYGQPGCLYRGVMWFQGQLIGALRGRVGEVLLGRIGKGMGQPGMNAPFVFESATADNTCVARAQGWLAQHAEFITPLPIPQTQPVSPAPVANPAQQQTVLERMQRQAEQPFPPSHNPSGGERATYGY